MIGTLIILPLPDKYGTATILKISSLISLFFHLNLLLNIGRPIGGIFCQISTLSYSLFTEFFPNNKNGLLIGKYNVIFPFSEVFFKFLFYASYTWEIFIFNYCFNSLLLYIYYFSIFY